MTALQKLIEYGQSYWIDNLTRHMIECGDLKRRVTAAGLRGLTSNPTIFNKAITQSTDYDTQIKQNALEHRSVYEIYEQLVVTDIKNACDILRPVYEESNSLDGYASLEVSPHLAHDTEGTINEARHLWNTVNRPNLLIKVPGTAAGVPAIEQLLHEGINVNVTLLFSVQTYEAVAEAFLKALERRAQEGKSIDNIASVASFFLSRIDTLADQLLSHRIVPVGQAKDIDPQQLMGKIAISNAKLAYQGFKQILQSERWKKLEKKGANPQRLLWASTSTKNPSYSDVMYVEPLIGAHTVNTMPDETIAAFEHHGAVKNTVEENVDDARKTMEDLEKLGIDINLVTEQLLNEGVQKFIDPFDALIDSLEEKRLRYMNEFDAPPLKEMARKLRREVIRMTTEAGSGHATSSMSCAELVAALFFHEMRWDPSDSQTRNVDKFVLSKGHAAPVLWAALYEAGAIKEDLLSLRKFGSSLEGHPTPNNPWVKVATGSLGQGLAAANGIALADRLDGIASRVFCLLGDGECSEGSVWEAAQFTALQKLSNLVAIVDVNALGQSGPTPYRHDTGVFARRFEAFGWKAVEIDGHDMQAILDTFDSTHKQGGPTAIIARTEKGKGVSFLEGKDGWHGKALDRDKMEEALKELNHTEATVKVETKIRVEPRRIGSYEPVRIENIPTFKVDYKIGDQVATRNAFGNALTKLGSVYPQVVVLDGDVKNSTMTEMFAEEFPERFFESYIAEQNMTGTALGLAVSGKIPFAATFACFLSRAYDFIRMAGHSRPPRLVFCGSHAGVSIGEDGPSQMGLEDIAMFRAVNGSAVLYPSDAVSAERLTEQAAQANGIIYIRTTRPKTPVLYSNDEQFSIGGSKVLRQSERDAFTVVGAGITLHEALAAFESLKTKGINVRVIDAYSVKPLDAETIAKAARETQGVIVVEDHWIDGGLGDVVAVAVGTQCPVYKLAVSEEPRSGTQQELLEKYGISRKGIEQKVLDLANQMGLSAA
jgi:transketolase